MCKNILLADKLLEDGQIQTWKLSLQILLHVIIIAPFHSSF